MANISNDSNLLNSRFDRLDPIDLQLQFSKAILPK